MSIETFYNLPEEKQKSLIQGGLKEFSSRSYQEASTDAITRECGISKGILFHYFKSKKIFYLFILEHCVKLLTQPVHQASGNDFYEIIFLSMDRKMELFQKYPLEIKFVNLAAKETNGQIAEEKNKLLGPYMLRAKEDSGRVIQKAAEKLSLKTTEDRETIVKALSMYVNTIIMNYLEQYKDKPEDFFHGGDKIKGEIKEYLNIFLYGVLREV